MEVDNSLQFQYFKHYFSVVCESYDIKNLDKQAIIDNFNQFKTLLTSIPTDLVEDHLLQYVMPSVEKLLNELYQENDLENNFTTEERELCIIDNLNICISLVECIQAISSVVSSELGKTDLILFKSFFAKGPACFHSTYKHCKNSQKTYQSLKRNCTEILELYKKNQECYMMFLNILNSVNICEDQYSIELFVQVINSVSDITEILFEILNIKAISEGWKGYCNIIEKQFDILSQQKMYCVREIRMLSRQICDLMEIVLEKNENKMKLQYVKLSGFLLKIAIKLMEKFWESLMIQYPQDVHQFVCSILSFSLKWIPKWNLDMDIQDCIKTRLISVITPFVKENILSSFFLQRLFSIESFCGNSRGCLIMDIHILRYLNNLEEHLECDQFSRFLEHVFSDLSSYSSDVIHKFELDFCELNDLCNEISVYIVNHEASYNISVEQILLHNTLGKNIYNYYIASSVWIDVLSSTAVEVRDELIDEFIISIKKLDSVLYNSPKVIFLKNFVERIFIILTDKERIQILEKHNLEENLEFQNIVGMQMIDKNNMDSLIRNSFDKLCDIGNCDSADQLIQAISTLKFIATTNSTALNKYHGNLSDHFQLFWKHNYEDVDVKNSLLEVIISTLTQATIAYMDYFSINQLCDILIKMKALSLVNSKCIIYLCEILRSIHPHLTRYNVEQNKLNSLISDIFEVILTVDEEKVKDLAFEIFHEFSNNNHLIIVNNVLRMLPNMKLEHYSKNENEWSNLRFLQEVDLSHECLKQKYFPKNFAILEDKPRSNFELTRHNSLEFSNNELLKPFQENYKNLSNLRNEMTSDSQNRTKRIKLIEVSQTEDDSVSEVLQRIKNEIKCLNKTLSKESLTVKNAQAIKMIIRQLENTLS